MISQYRPKSSFTLVRNPYFHQWSYAAQPAGYPSVIRYERVLSQSQQESAVITGRADLVEVGGGTISLSPSDIRPVSMSALSWALRYVFLNTRQPPFTNVKARQAINYAIDRARILQFFHFAPGQAAATCQILPADFPGHQSYCPYTGGAKNGIWHVPDMAKALRLVKDSGTTNMPVTVLTFKDFPWKDGKLLPGPAAQRARIPGTAWTRFPLTSFSQSSATPAAKSRWVSGQDGAADFPAPSAFFLPLLSCRSSHRVPHQQLGRVLRSSRRQAGQPGRSGTTYGSRRRPKAVGTGRPHRHRPGTICPGLSRSNGRIRLLPGRELPRFPGVWTSARPDVGQIERVFTRRC